MNEEPSTADGKSCGRCTFCCKILGVDALQKPRGTWCPHCVQNRGCSVYETRPEECRRFVCDYLRLPEFGPDWKPDKARFLMMTDAAHGMIYVELDPQQPDAWRKEPYLSGLKATARDMVRTGRLIVIRNGQRTIVLLPDEEVDLGIVGPDEAIWTEKRGTAPFVQYRVSKVKKNDRRVVREASPRTLQR
jgi:hypothetical protein